ncbi:MAG: rhodanese-like domain-containing protein [Gemmatimonadales bacterium]
MRTELRANLYRPLALAALVLGGLASVAGSPVAASNALVDVSNLAKTVDREDDHVTAIELAGWIKERRGGVRIVDVRDSAEFEEYHIPGAERVSLSDLVTTPFRRDETIVLYSDGGAHAAQGWVFLRSLGYKRVYFLRGGLYEWLDDVMNPALSIDATDSARGAFKKVAEISRYFGGVPRVSDSSAAVPPMLRGQSKNPKSATAVARVRGRGC